MLDKVSKNNLFVSLIRSISGKYEKFTVLVSGYFTVALPEAPGTEQSSSVY